MIGWIGWVFIFVFIYMAFGCLCGLVRAERGGGGARFFYLGWALLWPFYAFYWALDFNFFEWAVSNEAIRRRVLSDVRVTVLCDGLICLDVNIDELLMVQQYLLRGNEFSGLSCCEVRVREVKK